MIVPTPETIPNQGSRAQILYIELAGARSRLYPIEADFLDRILVNSKYSFCDFFKIIIIIYKICGLFSAPFHHAGHLLRLCWRRVCGPDLCFAEILNTVSRALLERLTFA